RDRLLRCERRQLTVTKLTVAGCVHDEMILRFALISRYAPLGGGRAFHHQARSGSGIAHRVSKIANRTGTVGVLRTVLRITKSLLNFDFRPICIEFIRDHRRQPGANSGSHLGSVCNNDYSPVGLDSKVNAWMPRGIVDTAPCSGGGRHGIQRKQASAE